MNEVIAIVGGGSTAISFLHSYLQLVHDGHVLPNTIYLFEKRGVFGPGAAYEPDQASNILNTKTGFVTPFDDRPGDFYQWLQTNKSTWRRLYPNFRLDAHGYAPRPLFGIYLQYQLQLLVNRAAALQINIIQISAEVIDVSNIGHSSVVKTDGNLDLRADYVFFFCGTLSARPQSAQSERVLQKPYPVRDLPVRIPSAATVGIAGSRLSCIDSVVALVEQGHRGSITIHSRSGFFPSVRGTQGRIEPHFLTVEQINAMVQIKGKLHLEDIVQLVQKEIARISGCKVNKKFLPPSPPKDLATFLREEIVAAAGDRVWQAVLYSTNGIIDRLWSVLHEEDKQTFLNRYFSIFMAYRVSIPVENARKILGYLESGQLRFQSGDFNIQLDPNGYPELHAPDGSIDHYDYLIQAMGSPRQVGSLDSNLLSRMLQRGSMVSHKFGGVQIDADSYHPITANGQSNDRAYVVGELTAGMFFFTSALDINARHARQCAKRFADDLRRNNGSSEAVRIQA